MTDLVPNFKSIDSVRALRLCRGCMVIPHDDAETRNEEQRPQDPRWPSPFKTALVNTSKVNAKNAAASD